MQVEKMKQTIVSKSPRTGQVLGKVAITQVEQAHQIIAKAKEAARTWGASSFAERRGILRRANHYIHEHFDEIAALIAKENGKPSIEAGIAEILPAIYHNKYFADNAQRLLADEKIDVFPWNLIGKNSYLYYQPLGTIGIISPWNYPFGIPMTQIAMALSAGNTVVMKPSSSVPLIGEKIKEIWDRAGVPEGVFNIIQGPGALGEVLIEENVDRLIFTGSVAIGRHVAKLAAEKLLPVTLELGGKDPAIVLADADLDAATSGILWGAMTNAGQTCAGIERVYVHQDVYDDFVDRIVKKAEKLRLCTDKETACDIGAITSESQLQIIHEQVEQAKKAGAHVHLGGEILQINGGIYYPPTIVTNVVHGMPIVSEETFGPILPIMSFKREDDAVRLANDSRFGLSASVWTADEAAGRRIAKKLVAGTVTINDSLYTYSLAQTPWGGVKESGLGRTHGKEGLLEMVRTVHVSTDRFYKIKKPWWYPYNENVNELFKNMVALLGKEGVAEKAKTASKMVRQLPFWPKL